MNTIRNRWTVITHREPLAHVRHACLEWYNSPGIIGRGTMSTDPGTGKDRRRRLIRLMWFCLQDEVTWTWLSWNVSTGQGSRPDVTVGTRQSGVRGYQDKAIVLTGILVQGSELNLSTSLDVTGRTHLPWLLSLLSLLYEAKKQKKKKKSKTKDRKIRNKIACKTVKKMMQKDTDVPKLPL